MSRRDRKQLACAISFRDVSLLIAPLPNTDEYAARHSHAHCVFLVTGLVESVKMLCMHVYKWLGNSHLADHFLSWKVIIHLRQQLFQLKLLRCRQNIWVLRHLHCVVIISGTPPPPPPPPMLQPSSWRSAVDPAELAVLDAAGGKAEDLQQYIWELIQTEHSHIQQLQTAVNVSRVKGRVGKWRVSL